MSKKTQSLSKDIAKPEISKVPMHLSVFAYAT